MNISYIYLIVVSVALAAFGSELLTELESIANAIEVLGK